MSHFNNMDDRASLELRFLIPSKAAGVIIGKGGETIKEIREKYEIKVNISDSSGPERVLQVIGRSNAVMDALQMMVEKAKDCIPASDAEIYTEGSRGRFRPRRSRNNGEDAVDSGNGIIGVDLRMLIHQSQAGGVIGRGGERIKELREQVELKTLKVYQNGCPSSTDRVVQMVGEIPKVLNCVRTISEMLQTFQIRGVEQPYDARNFDESLALSYGGWLHRATLKAVQDYGVQALSGLAGGGGIPGLPMGPNGPGVPDSAMAAIVAARSSMMNQGTQPQPSRHPQHPAMTGAPWMPMMMTGSAAPGSGAPGATGGGGGNRRLDMAPGGGASGHLNLMGVAGNMERAAFDVYTKTVRVSVPNMYMGAIMGRAGVRIRSIREESGAEIHVHEPNKNETDRIIEITGTPAQITYAQQLLKNCVLLYQDKK